MKALTLTQPWASLMALQKKRIETRSWRTEYRGELVVHAAKGFPQWAKETCEEPEFAAALGSLTAANLPRSRGLCVVRLLACLPTGPRLADRLALLGAGELTRQEELFGDYAIGRYAWVTTFMRPMDNVGPVKGSLGLWDWAKSDQARAELDFEMGRAHL